MLTFQVRRATGADLRTVAELFIDGRNVGAEMISLGWAWYEPKFPNADHSFPVREAEARTAHRGLWADPAPIPPWQWRLEHGQIMLMSDRGETWRFEADDNAQWRLVPDSANPLIMLRQ